MKSASSNFFLIFFWFVPVVLFSGEPAPLPKIILSSGTERIPSQENREKAKPTIKLLKESDEGKFEVHSKTLEESTSDVLKLGQVLASRPIQIASFPQVSAIPPYVDLKNMASVPEIPIDAAEIGSIAERIASESGELAVASNSPGLSRKGGKYEKKENWPPIEPFLIAVCNFEAEKKEKQESKIERLEGRLAVEEHLLGKKKFFRRWVIVMANGDKVPLVSNMNLLTAVKTPGILDGYVLAEGKWRNSPSNKELRFFAPERFQRLEALSDLASSTASVTSAVPGGVMPEKTAAPSSSTFIEYIPEAPESTNASKNLEIHGVEEAGTQSNTSSNSIEVPGKGKDG